MDPAPYIRKDERRAMIAAAARRLIAERGYAALRTREVAAEVGINISTLHHHVPSKAALALLVAETTRDAFLALLPPAPEPARPARAQLQAEAAAYRASLQDRPELAACYAQLSQSCDDPKIQSVLKGFTENWLARWTRILEIGRAQGAFRADLAPLPAALAITGALTAFGHRGPGGAARDLTLFTPVFEELERGLLARQPTETT